MKKYSLFISLLLLFCISASFVSPAYAANTLSASVSFNPESGLVTVNATTSGYTVIKVLPYGNDESSVTSGGTQYTHFEHISPNDMPYSFYMPDWAEFGKYTVYVVSSPSSDDTFMYYDTTVADTRTASLNSAQSALALSEQIWSDASALGMDKDDNFISSHYKKASEILFEAFMPFVDSSDFYNKFNACLAMAALNGVDKTKAEEILSGYSTYLGIVYSEKYASLGSDLAADLCNIFSAMDFVGEFKKLEASGKQVSFSNLFDRTVALCAARISNNWSALKKVFDTDYVSVLQEITSANSSFTKDVESKTYMNLVSKKPYTSISDLKSKFDLSVTEAVSQNTAGNKPQTNRPGGSVSTPSGYTNPTNQYDETISGNGNSEENSVVSISVTKPVLTADLASYTDVYASSWEYQAVGILGGNGIISGYEDGSYKGNNPITRAEFAKLIVAAFNVTAPLSSFDDVSDSDWFCPYVQLAGGSGIVTGYNGKFNPNSYITREDAAVIIYRTAALAGKEYTGSASFADSIDISVYAMTAVRGLGDAGIINGDNNFRFNPESNLTRSEAAQLLYNFINALGE